jgi:hypothetical protein
MTLFPQGVVAVVKIASCSGECSGQASILALSLNKTGVSFLDESPHSRNSTIENLDQLPLLRDPFASRNY